MSFVIRSVQPGDRRRFDELARHIAHDGSTRSLAASEIDRYLRADHDRGVALVALAGDHVIAAARVDRAPHSDEGILSMVVAPPWRAHGIASVLLNVLAGEAARAGVTIALPAPRHAVPAAVESQAVTAAGERVPR
jgi:GNAT superfamily N-acetyltransferase